MTTMTARAEPATGPGTVRLPSLAWVVWRQHRAALTGLLLLAGAGAVVAIVSGLSIRTAYNSYIGHHCTSSWAASACSAAANQFSGYKEGPVPIALHVFPVLIGVFLGAPLLAREIEAGTFRFAWTQQAGRTRWLLVNLLLLGLAVIVICVLVGALATWWLHPFDVAGVSSRWQAGEFDVAPAALAGWGLLAFAAGVLAGALVKRTVPAMAVTAVAVTAMLGLFWFKLDYLVLSVAASTASANPIGLASGLVGPGPAAINAWALAGSGQANGGWLVRGWFTQAGGHPMTARTYQRVTGTLLSSDGRQIPDPMRWLAAHHDAFLVAYQPGGRFWAFQLGTAAALLLLALALATAAVAVIRRRGA
jgi:hypothetical protein